MPSTKFLVQWEDHTKHLATRLGYLLENQQLVDVTLMCNTHTLKVHRAVLAACSPYFERKLGEHPLIVLKDMKFTVLKALIEFMYCGETSVSEENLPPLLEAAKFFEVRGLSSMTKDVLNSRINASSAQVPPSQINGTIPRAASGRGRGRGGGRGRGRGGHMLLQDSGTNPVAVRSPGNGGNQAESAQILLSLSSGNATLSHTLQTTSRNVRIDPNRMSKAIRNGGLKTARGTGKRGRKKQSLMATDYARGLLPVSEVDASHMAVESLKTEIQDMDETLMCSDNPNSVEKSPLLASLLCKAESLNRKIKVENSSPDLGGGGDTEEVYHEERRVMGSAKYFQVLKNSGLPTNVPILIDNGDGNYVTLTEDVLMNVIEGNDYQLQITESGNVGEEQVGEGVVLQDGTIMFEGKSGSIDEGDQAKKSLSKLPVRQFVVKDMQVARSDEEDFVMTGGVNCNEAQEMKCVAMAKPTIVPKLQEAHAKTSEKQKLSVQEYINEAVLQSLKSCTASDSELDPDAVMLFEVTDDSKVEKYIVSSKEVNALKALNKQIMQQKNMVRDVPVDSSLHNIGVIGGNTKIAEVKLTVGKTNLRKSIVTQVVECAQGLEERVRKMTGGDVNQTDERNVSSEERVRSKVESNLEYIGNERESLEVYAAADGCNERLEEFQVTESGNEKDGNMMELLDMVCEGSGEQSSQGDGMDYSLNAEEASHENKVIVEHMETDSGVEEQEQNNQAMEKRLQEDTISVRDCPEMSVEQALEAMMGDNSGLMTGGKAENKCTQDVADLSLVLAPAGEDHGEMSTKQQGYEFVFNGEDGDEMLETQVVQMESAASVSEILPMIGNEEVKGAEMLNPVEDVVKQQSYPSSPVKETPSLMTHKALPSEIQSSDACSPKRRISLSETMPEKRARTNIVSTCDNESYLEQHQVVIIEEGSGFNVLAS